LKNCNSIFVQASEKKHWCWTYYVFILVEQSCHYEIYKFKTSVYFLKLAEYKPIFLITAETINKSNFLLENKEKEKKRNSSQLFYSLVPKYWLFCKYVLSFRVKAMSHSVKYVPHDL
jgi:hypothetical protein